MAFPMPLPAPVITATLSRRENRSSAIRRLVLSSSFLGSTQWEGFVEGPQCCRRRGGLQVTHQPVEKVVDVQGIGTLRSAETQRSLPVGRCVQAPCAHSADSFGAQF